MIHLPLRLNALNSAIGVGLCFKMFSSIFLSLNVCCFQFVGLGSALSMGLDSMDNSLLAEQPDLTCKLMTYISPKHTPPPSSLPLQQGQVV